jgi:hypothetical protein
MKNIGCIKRELRKFIYPLYLLHLAFVVAQMAGDYHLAAVAQMTDAFAELRA